MEKKVLEITARNDWFRELFWLCEIVKKQKDSYYNYKEVLHCDNGVMYATNGHMLLSAFAVDGMIGGRSYRIEKKNKSMVLLSEDETDWPIHAVEMFHNKCKVYCEYVEVTGKTDRDICSLLHRSEDFFNIEYLQHILGIAEAGKIWISNDPEQMVWFELDSGREAFLMPIISD